MGSRSPSISIVIINYNGLVFLSECIRSLTSIGYPPDEMEIIVVDNASTDGSTGCLEREFPRVTVLARDRNYGFARASNIGARHARGEYLVFLNNDTVVMSGWLEELVRVMEADRDVGIAGSKLLLMDSPGKINSAGGIITFTGGGYDFGFMDDDGEGYNVSGSRGYICAASMIVRREEFLTFGGFDVDYFMYFEDVDLCWRYWLCGKDVAYVPASVVYHKFGGTANSSRHSSLRVFYGTRNSLLNMTKNYGARTLLFAFPLTLLYHLLKTLYFVASLRGGAALAMIKAHSSFVRLLPGALDKRRAIQKLRRIGDRVLFDRCLIDPLSSTLREFLRLLRT